MEIDFSNRLKEYDKEHCFQYEMRLQNLNGDLARAPFYYTQEELMNSKISDFVFRNLTDEEEKLEAGEFIKRHEWLGKLALNTTHYFGAYYKGIVLSGVITMGVPSAFSNLMGEDTKEIERLISRGACISWSPKCLASSFMMWCIRWMVENTQYRLFTAYSDPTAKELGTIYQACNFYYIGNQFGEPNRYISPYSGKIISSRCFRSRSYYKRYAIDLGIIWQKNWSTGDKVNWENIPDDVEQKLREYSKHMEETSEKVLFPKKHKYAFVLGKDKRETYKLRKQFESLNEIYPYPKDRGK